MDDEKLTSEDNTSFREMMQNRNIAHVPDKVQNFRRPEYTFHPNFERKIRCSAVTSPTGRVYTTPDGNRYPSITTVLSGAKSDSSKKALEKWRADVGKKEAKRITKAATNRGTALHKLVEKFIKSKEPEYPIEGDLNGRLFRQIHPFLERITEIHSLEQPLYSNILKVAGRDDLIGLYDQKLSIVDFKSSTKPKLDSWIEDYFIQTTAYAVMFGELFPGFKVEQLVIIMAVENSSQPQIFIRKPGDYLEALVAKIKRYHELNVQ